MERSVSANGGAETAHMCCRSWHLPLEGEVALRKAILPTLHGTLLGPRQRARRHFVTDHHAALHDELHALHLADIGERISRHGDDVGELAAVDAADLARPVIVEHL